MDYQATTPLDPSILKSMEKYSTELFGNPHSADHIFGWRSQQAVDKAKNRIAALIGSDGEEIIFTSGATEANNLAIFGATHFVGHEKKRILVSSIEHKSVLEVARVLSDQYQIITEVVPVDKYGFIDFSRLSEIISYDVLLVSIMAVNNEIGTIQNIEKIGALAHQHGAIFHCDAAQAPLAVDIDVRSANIDLLSLSSHKIYGPKGIGALYVSNDINSRIKPIIHGGGQQNGLRSGTVPTPLCVGFGEAVAKLDTEKGKIERRQTAELRDYFIEKLCEASIAFTVNGPPSEGRHPGNVNLAFNGYDAHSILSSLQPNLCASTGAACASGIIESSYILKAIGLPDTSAFSSIRFSLGRYSNEDQIEEAVLLLKKTIDSLS